MNRLNIDKCNINKHVYICCIINISFYNPCRSLVIKAKLEPLLPIIEEICKGLNCYNICDLVKQNPDVMRPVFCRTGSFEWTYENFVDALKPQFSQDGGNKKPLEVTTYKALLDFIEFCFNAGKF